MDNKIIQGTLLVGASLLAMLCMPLLSQDSLNHEEVAWTRNSSYLDAFLADPIANLSILERMDDWYYWTLVYGNMKGIPFMMRELFSNKLPANNADEAQLDAIFRLLKAYSSPLSYELKRPIISRTIEIASNRPEWFARNLLSRDDWKEILRLIVKEISRSIIRGDVENSSVMRGGLKNVLLDLEDGENKKKLMDSFAEIENEERKDSEKLSEFIRDPSQGLDRIDGIYDLCGTMGPMYLSNSFDLLTSWIAKEPDEYKVAVLFHFMTHCDGAYHLEIMVDLAVDFFLGHMPLVVPALKRTRNWKWIVLFVSYWLCEEDEEFKSTINALGSTEFEIKIRSQLEFLRDHISY